MHLSIGCGQHHLSGAAIKLVPSCTICLIDRYQWSMAGKLGAVIGDYARDFSNEAGLFQTAEAMQGCSTLCTCMCMQGISRPLVKSFRLELPFCIRANARYLLFKLPLKKKKAILKSGCSNMGALECCFHSIWDKLKLQLPASLVCCEWTNVLYISSLPKFSCVWLCDAGCWTAVRDWVPGHFLRCNFCRCAMCWGTFVHSCKIKKWDCGHGWGVLFNMHVLLI